MAVGFYLHYKTPNVSRFYIFSSSSDTFSVPFYFFDEFDHGAIGYAIFTEEVDFNFETYLPALY
jgi:hypothetical protein